MISQSQKTAEAAQDILEGRSRRGRVARLIVFMGPAFIACVAYMDPGNFATNIQGGAQYGYMLLWVVVASNLIAVLIQTLSAKLGLATGHNLAEICRMHYPRPMAWVMWVLMEIVAMATDLAEFLGAAIGFNLLFGMPLWIAGLITAVVTFLILGLERYGFRPLEAVISSFVGVIALCYLFETVLDQPAWLDVFHGAVTPRFADRESVLLAAGILGATVMPHVIFLHSALTQGRIVVRDPVHRRRLLRFEMVDVGVAMGLAGLINAAMLIMAASTFHRSGMTSVGSLEEAYKTLEPLLGPAASWVFAISLLASGLSSSSVGTMSAQVIMQGFIQQRIPIWIRRLVTMFPTFVVIAMGLDPTRTLVISQVVLSFGLPFAVIPLVQFTRRKDIMGDLVNRRGTTLLAWAVAALIVALNLYLLYCFLGKDLNMFKHLLVPLDGSRLAEAAIPAAVCLAKKGNAVVTLLHIIEHNAPEKIHGEHHLRAAEEAAAYLDKVARRHFGGIRTHGHVHTAEIKDVARGIADHRIELDPDTVVMSAHGFGGLRNLLFGNIAQQVVALGSMPVLLVRPGNEFECRHVLIPHDGVLAHEPALNAGTEFARLCGADVQLVMVVPTRGTLSGLEAAAGQILPGATRVMLEMAQRDAADHLLGHAEELMAGGIFARAEILRGDPAPRIVKAGETFGANVIVLGTHGRSGTKAFWEGSVSARVAMKTKASLLFVPVEKK